MYGTKFLIADHYYIYNVVREDSQIDIATGKVSLHVWEGGGGREGDRRTYPSQSSNNYRENLVSKKEYYMQHNFTPKRLFKLGKIWHMQLHFRMPIGTICMNYRPTRPGLD